MIDRVRHHLVKSLGAICALIFAALVIDVLWGVFTRQVLNNQPAWTEELARLLLVWLALFGGVLAYAGDNHLGIDVITSRLDARAKRIANSITHLSVIAFALFVLIWGGLELFASRWQSGQVLPAMQIRKAWFYLVLPLSGGLLVLLAILKIASSPREPEESEGAKT
ncbi:MAG: TRAP transporter small permease [Verrucomicrobiota bacterium]